MYMNKKQTKKHANKGIANIFTLYVQCFYLKYYFNLFSSVYLTISHARLIHSLPFPLPLPSTITPLPPSPSLSSSIAFTRWHFINTDFHSDLPKSQIKNTTSWLIDGIRLKGQYAENNKIRRTYTQEFSRDILFIFHLFSFNFAQIKRIVFYCIHNYDLSKKWILK